MVEGPLVVANLDDCTRPASVWFHAVNELALTTRRRGSSYSVGEPSEAPNWSGKGPGTGSFGYESFSGGGGVALAVLEMGSGLVTRG